MDKPRFLSRLLAEHSDYFARQGIDVGALTNDDACARRLLEVFTQPDDAMPGALLQALYILDALADEAGHERILEEANRCSVDLGAMPDDLCPGDFALVVWFKRPRLVRVCHEKTVCRSFKRYYEFRSRDERRLDLTAVRAKIRELQEILGPWFDSRQRTRACEVFAYEEGPKIRYLVTHGALYRTDGSITAKLERSRIGYRPQRHDSILYDTGTGILKIHTQFAPERIAYREAFGRILFEDPAYFPEGPTYTLECLRTNGSVLAVVAGMRSVRLTEVWIEWDTEKCRQQILKGDDLTEMVAGCGSLDIARGEIVRASFSIEYSSGGRARRLEVCLPNVADHDRDRDGPVVDAFLRVNHLLAAESDGAGLELLWQRLETNFPLGGARRHLQDDLGGDIVAVLERTGILKQRRVADTYPCPGPRGDGCPRQVIEIDGAYHAVCGNNPAECQDITLAPADVAFLAVDPVSLCRGIASALQIYAIAEAIAMIVDAYRVGTFIPEPGIKRPVFFVVRTSARRYAEALDALRSRQEGDPFTVLVPTDRFLSDDVGRSMRRARVTVLALAEIIGLSNGHLTALADPLRLFAELRQNPVPFGRSPEIVAHALVRDAGQPPCQLDLDQRRYEDLLATADQYDVFADERDRSVRKKSGETRRDVQVSHFRSIRAAVTKTGYFDPNAEGPDLPSGKQIFQRARAIFDMKSGKSSWRIFTSIRTDEGHTVYSFSPDADVSFAFIFLPES